MAKWPLRVVATLVFLCGTARADEGAPWSKGITAAQKAEAQELLEKGNSLFLSKDYRSALEHYALAVAVWDHPAIRFNMVRALIQLDKNVEAFENLELALAYGDAPLEEAVYQEALSYRKVLASSIAVLEISCEQPGVAVLLDGTDFLMCPGTKSARVAPGNHSVVAEKADFLTLSQSVATFSGTPERVDIRLVSLTDATVMTRHWPAWKPWAVVGAGVALGGLGGLLQLQAQADFDRYDEALALQCPEGCAVAVLLDSTRDMESRARLENRIALGTMVAGGAVAASGLAMVILNRPRATLPDQPAARTTQVVPAVTGDMIGLAVGGWF